MFDLLVDIEVGIRFCLLFVMDIEGCHSILFVTLVDIEGWHSMLFVILVAPDVDWSVKSQSSRWFGGYRGLAFDFVCYFGCS